MRGLGLALLLLLTPISLQVERVEQLIVWNVGQGLWVTVATFDRCVHFDIGGEKINWKKVSSQCGSKAQNEAHFSHWDLDHISFVARAARELKNFCVASYPAGPTTLAKEKTFKSLARCSNGDASGARELKFTPSRQRKTVANDFSRVFTMRHALLPGDSTAPQERIWSRQLGSSSYKLLILGHHGSKTSTSPALLRQLKNLKQAIASARQRKYGHPHPLVITRLRKHGAAALSTEQWGDIHFGL